MQTEEYRNSFEVILYLFKCCRLSWIIIYSGMVIVISIVVAALMAAGGFVTESNLGLLLCILLLYGASLITLSLALSTLFSRARAATAITGLATLVFSCAYVPVYVYRDEGSYDSDIPLWGHWLMCVLSPAAFVTCIDQVNVC